MAFKHWLAGILQRTEWRKRIEEDAHIHAKKRKKKKGMKGYTIHFVIYKTDWIASHIAKLVERIKVHSVRTKKPF